MKKLFLSFFISFMSVASWGYDFEVDGIYYNVLDMANRTVEVTHSGEREGTFSVSLYGYMNYPLFCELPRYKSNYGGQVSIPKEVTYKGKKFSVVRIGDYAFTGQNNIISLSLPSSIMEISYGKSLKEVTATSFPGNRGYPQMRPFTGCSNLTEIKCGTALVLKSLNDLKYETQIYKQIKKIVFLDDFQDDISFDFTVFTNLSELISLAPIPPVISSSTFSNNQYMNLPVYVQENCLETYQQADKWNDFWGLTPMKAAQSISIDKQKIELKPEETCQVLVTILPGDAYDKNVDWTSSNPEVAQVIADGVVIGKTKGDAVITATTTDGTNLSATCDVHVDCFVESIELNSKILILEPSSTSQLSVTILPEEAFVKDVVWQSLDETVASVDASGNVTANGIGKTQVVVSTTDGTELSDTCEVMVMNLSSIEIGGLYYKVGTDGAIVIPSPNGDKYDGNIEIPSNIVIPDFATINVTTIASDAFANATSLRKIALPATISSIGVGAFASCSSLEFVGVENGSELSANFDEVFADSKIKELYLGSDNVTFNDGSKLLSGLRSIVIGNSVTRLPDVAVCNNSLERFIVEDGGNSILEPSDYCKKSFTLTYQQTPNTDNVYYRFGYLVTIIHLNPLAELINNKTIKDIYFGREVERVEIDMPTYETKPTSAGSRYQEFGYRDEYNYQYQEYIAKTDYKEMELTSIALNKDKVVMEIGGTVQLYVVNNPSSVPTTNVVKWYSSDNSIATVDAFGLVTLMAKGEATITAETLDGTKLNASCQIMDIETGVNSIADGRCNDNDVYNLSGVRVMKMKSISDSKQLPQGVYIINGKKRFVK